MRKDLDTRGRHLHITSQLGLRLCNQQVLIIGAVQEKGERNNEGGDEREGNEDKPGDLSAQIPHNEILPDMT
jgi:hypothetical protein